MDKRNQKNLTYHIMSISQLSLLNQNPINLQINIVNIRV